MHAPKLISARSMQKSGLLVLLTIAVSVSAHAAATDTGFIAPVPADGVQQGWTAGDPSVQPVVHRPNPTLRLSAEALPQTGSPKSEATAVVLSLGASAVSVYTGIAIAGHQSWGIDLAGTTLIAGGLLVGPTAGSLYAGDTYRALRGIVARLVSAGAVVVGAGPMGGFRILNDSDPMGLAVMFAGFGSFAITTLYDMFFSSRYSVRDYNEALNRQAGASLSPWVAPGGSGGGVSLDLRF